jgi:hypothetical protein
MCLWQPPFMIVNQQNTFHRAAFPTCSMEAYLCHIQIVKCVSHSDREMHVCARKQVRTRRAQADGRVEAFHAEGWVPTYTINAPPNLTCTAGKYAWPDVHALWPRDQRRQYEEQHDSGANSTCKPGAKITWPAYISIILLRLAKLIPL